jgi:YbgC/YbaW family acyl-CoA thioester hydrolase
METTKPPFLYRARVEFADTDMAGIMHFSNYFRFMERAEHAFWRSLGFSVHAELEGRTVSWPRVKAVCDYRLPLRFDDEMDVEVSIFELKPKSVAFSFRFIRQPDAEVTAEGKITAVCTAYNEEAGRMRAISMPPQVASKLEAAFSPHEQE